MTTQRVAVQAKTLGYRDLVQMAIAAGLMLAVLWIGIETYREVTTWGEGIFDVEPSAPQVTQYYVAQGFEVLVVSAFAMAAYMGSRVGE